LRDRETREQRIALDACRAYRKGTSIVKEEAAFRASYVFGAAFERMDARLRQWPAAGLSLLTVALILAAAAVSGY
jgi:hypothetical protein